MNGGLREEQDLARVKVSVDKADGPSGTSEAEAATGVANVDDADGVDGTQIAAGKAGADGAGGIDEFDVVSEAGRSEDERGKNSFSSYLLYLAWLVSVVATLGSLYFSEIRGFIPCELCWYQRILMYPLSVILGIAAYHNDLRIKKYILPLSIVGICVSLYHYLLQKVPGFALARPCVQGVPCDAMYINWFGFITIPFLALVAFTLITISLLAIRNRG